MILSLRTVLSTALIVSGLSSSMALARSPGLGPIADFMTMDTCTGPDDRPVAGIPGDAGCKHHRDVQPGERPAYALRSFPSAGSRCPVGPVSKINLPITRDGKTRIVSSIMRMPACGASSGGDAEPASFPVKGNSIQWHDDGYGFIMGSYSPASLSSLETDLCAQNSNSSQRFFRGWVIAPADVPALGTSGYGMFSSKLLKGGASLNMGACAKRYNRSLTTWAVDDFTFKSGRRTASIVSSRYSRTAPGGMSPGDAMQMEQTYWTREFGLSRWEKWAREDWVHPRFQKSAIDLAGTLAASGRCSMPLSQPLAFSGEMQLTGVEDRQGVYSRVIDNPLTGERHRWYMTLCEDFTNAAALPASVDPISAIMAKADEAYWK